MTVQPEAELISLRLRLVRTVVRHRMTENRGALIRDHEPGEVEKRDKKNSHGNVCAS
jgi:hypothetical protein